MMTKHKLLFLISFLILGKIDQAHAQSLDKDRPLKLAILDESLILPGFKFLRYGFNPTLMVGTEYRLNKNSRSSWHLSGNLGFFYHKESQVGIFLQPEIGYRYPAGRWSFRLGAGPGYLHSFSTGPVYKLEDGNFSEVNELGSPTFLVSATAEVAYDLKQEAKSPSLYLIWMNSAEVPFNFYTGIHQFVGLGIKFYPFNRKKKS